MELLPGDLRPETDAEGRQGPRPRGLAGPIKVFVGHCREAPRVLGVRRLHVCPREAPLATVWGCAAVTGGSTSRSSVMTERSREIQLEAALSRP